MAKLIVLEGMDGCGKTTLAAALVEKLTGLGKTVVAIREPGSSKLGEHLRSLIFKPPEPISGVTRTLLFQASRVDMLEKSVLPILDTTDYIILDRYTLSTYVYQHLSNVFHKGKCEVTADLLHVLMYHTLDARVRDPAAILFLDVDLVTALQRDPDGADFDTNQHSYMKAVHEAYRFSYDHRSMKTATQWLRVDANKTPDDVLSQSLEFVLGV